MSPKPESKREKLARLQHQLAEYRWLQAQFNVDPVRANDITRPYPFEIQIPELEVEVDNLWRSIHSGVEVAV